MVKGSRLLRCRWVLSFCAVPSAQLPCLSALPGHIAAAGAGVMSASAAAAGAGVMSASAAAAGIGSGVAAATREKCSNLLRQHGWTLIVSRIPTCEAPIWQWPHGGDPWRADGAILSKLPRQQCNLQALLGSQAGPGPACALFTHHSARLPSAPLPALYHACLPPPCSPCSQVIAAHKSTGKPLVHAQTHSR